MKDFEFKSLADLGEDIRTWLGWIPREFEIVVGVPRSGLLIANMISLHRHLPMTDVDGLASGRLIGGGNRFDVGDPAHFLAKPRRVLVVDDSVLTGRQMANVRSRLSRAPVRHDLSYAAVYVDPGKEDCVDYFHQALPFPRMFEWNLMHHPMLERACVDIDGVLCRDPTDVENDDGSRYADFLGDVTARCETGLSDRNAGHMPAREVPLADRGLADPQRDSVEAPRDDALCIQGRENRRESPRGVQSRSLPRGPRDDLHREQRRTGQGDRRHLCALRHCDRSHEALRTQRPDQERHPRRTAGSGVLPGTGTLASKPSQGHRAGGSSGEGTPDARSVRARPRLQ